MTPARAAFEKARELGIAPAGITWDALTPATRRKWADVAQAAAAGAPACKCDSVLRPRMTAIAARLYESAAATDPSKKSQIERDIAGRIRAGLEG